MMTPEAPLRILCIEDDAATALLIRRGLERRGYEVDVVSSGGEGFRRFQEAGWAAVLIDQQLPDEPGLDVLVRLCRLGELPATVMVSGRGNEAVAVAALKLGAHDYLVKDAADSYLSLLPEVVDRARALVEQRREIVRLAAERERLVVELTDALARIKTLSGLIPICAGCKSMRDQHGAWEPLETYLSRHSDAQLSHGFCPECLRRHYPEFVGGS